MIPGSGRSPRYGKGNTLQYSCLGNPWTEETGELQSMGSQSLKNDLATKQETTSAGNIIGTLVSVHSGNRSTE